MPKYIIRIFSNFCSSTECKNKYETIDEAFLESNYGNIKDIYITDGDDYTHAIIMNVAMPRLKNISKGNVIGLAFEPPHFLGLQTPFVHYAQKYIGKYLIGQTYGLPAPFIEYQGYVWHTPPLKSIPAKPNWMSIMVSQKSQAPGHKYRHELVSRILGSNLPIDIMGRGCKYYKPDPRLKGEFNGLEPYLSYQFHIAIENFQLNHYYSEKIMDPLFCGTTPVYLGCHNIDNYFPGMVIKLSGDAAKDFELLGEILKNPDEYRKHIDLDVVKNTTSFIKNVPKIFG
uniref:Fucosyltransferase C-terminal domain-containing protein n=1 Tax=viral metagenome TaxID=1070528 RepID=A0A6C0JXH0_9ZZZZ